MFSLLNYTFLRFLYLFKSNKKYLIKQFGFHNNVNIICPGPSAKKFDPQRAPGLSIYVNHAAHCIPLCNKSKKHNIHFSADPIRAKELINIVPEVFKYCDSVLVAGRLFSLTPRIFKYYKTVYLPQLTIDREYGLVSKGSSIETFSEMKDRSIGCGYGSLPAALSFCLIFKPKLIKLWGCDFGNIGSESYVNKKIPIRTDTPHAKIKNDVIKIKKIISNIGVQLIDSNDNI